MLEELRTLALFAEEGSIQKVARRLPLTQPAVTRQIQRLEEMLATELLDRRLKPPRLTGAGLEVLARGRDILAAVDALKSFARRAEPEGVLRLGLAHGLSDEYMAGAIARAVALFPRVSLRLTTGWSAELVEQHNRGQLDVAMTLQAGRIEGTGNVIGTERLCVVAGSQAGRLPDLAAASWVLSPKPCDARLRLVAALGNGHRLVVAAEIQDAAMQMEWVRMGYGLSLLPMRLIHQRMPDGIVPVEANGFDLSMQVVFLRSPHLHRLTKVADEIAAAVSAVFADDRN
ncbi:MULTISPECIES: LysR family transcriptional regulator [unclassified Mesorhizobium]|uniref:LysR family transcriptional regulator n=1 Tax=unclassified Mesorhizobium TaxID=325217 RepID=UPI000FD89EEF|nr:MULTISPECIES: LysR family transcriptional regulator [unclassified Mesorhizobium]TGQ44018.1 LysR family transcriptional regulator [Mesorhizobium sp. M00.F.Ca.ET.216.01.1.1]TIS59163.1 MAG: LysR family transcriptional regulator [Mesorhizobium sp.]TIS90853.1 MAG: LysR family transcriptional regulator [Mesorhizobium sp.]TJW48554.1 MAG: LysR family transcriptional regulator [Mesorhizobium sp.]